MFTTRNKGQQDGGYRYVVLSTMACREPPILFVPERKKRPISVELKRVALQEEYAEFS